jgi:large subunit ribosomal protein L29
MAKSKALAELGDAELLEALADAKQELLNLRFQVVTGQQENTARIGAVKKQVARIFTEQRAREIEAAEALEREEARS